MIKVRDGPDIYVEDVGKEPPIVVIHGWPLSGAMWDDKAVPLVEACVRGISDDFDRDIAAVVPEGRIAPLRLGKSFLGVV